MPSASRSSALRGRSPFRFAIITAVVALVVGVVLFLLVANNIGSSTKSSIRPGTEDFVVGQASPLADTLEREGPLLLPDLLGRSRDIYVQHLGGDDWRVFEARPEGAPRSCTLRWEKASRTFSDPCDRRTYPADGTGLTTYPTHVDEQGRVVVDLRSPEPPVAPPPVMAPPA